MSSQTVTDHALKITKVLNKHLNEENCTHSVKEVVREIFEN